MAGALPQDYSSLKARVDAALAVSVSDADWPESLGEAVRYSLLAGGKRLRPVLTLMAAQVCSERCEAALPAACAVEMVHTYSLIHDDLPAMDDDALRRGRPTSHVVFGEALAILAGDALLTQAFRTLAACDLPAAARADCLGILAQAAGGAGMVGGQVLDLEAERGTLSGRKGDNLPRRRLNGPNPADTSSGPAADSDRGQEPGSVAGQQSSEAEVGADPPNPASGHQGFHVEHLIQIHKMKTGALITAALEMGAAAVGADSEQRSRLVRFGQCIGLAFQIADDLLDLTGNDASLGKQAGRDLELGKLTYPSLIGIAGSRRKAAELIDEAQEALDAFTERAEPLRTLARFIVERDH